MAITTAQTAGKTDKECPICLEAKPIEAYMVGGYEKRGCNVCTYLPPSRSSGKHQFRVKSEKHHRFIDYYEPKLHDLYKKKLDNEGKKE